MLLDVDALLKEAMSFPGKPEEHSPSMTPSVLADQMEFLATKLGSVSTQPLSSGPDPDRNSAALATADFMSKLAGMIEQKKIKGIDRRLLAMFAGQENAKALSDRVEITDKYESMTGTRLQ